MTRRIRAVRAPRRPSGTVLEGTAPGLSHGG